MSTEGLRELSGEELLHVTGGSLANGCGYIMGTGTVCTYAWGTATVSNNPDEAFDKA